MPSQTAAGIELEIALMNPKLAIIASLLNSFTNKIFICITTSNKTRVINEGIEIYKI